MKRWLTILLFAAGGFATELVHPVQSVYPKRCGDVLPDRQAILTSASTRSCFTSARESGSAARSSFPGSRAAGRRPVRRRRRCSADGCRWVIEGVAVVM
nr:hypothetical protein [Burkholderia ubonensis]